MDEIQAWNSFSGLKSCHNEAIGQKKTETLLPHGQERSCCYSCKGMGSLAKLKTFE